MLVKWAKADHAVCRVQLLQALLASLMVMARSHCHLCMLVGVLAASSCYTLWAAWTGHFKVNCLHFPAHKLLAVPRAPGHG